MMRFIIDDDQTGGVSHLVQYFPYIGFITFCPAFIDAFLFLQFLLTIPCERVPVDDLHVSLPQGFHEARWDDVEFFIVVFFVKRF